MAAKEGRYLDPQQQTGMEYSPGKRGHDPLYVTRSYLPPNTHPSRRLPRRRGGFRDAERVPARRGSSGYAGRFSRPPEKCPASAGGRRERGGSRPTGFARHLLQGTDGLVLLFRSIRLRCFRYSHAERHSGSDARPERPAETSVMSCVSLDRHDTSRSSEDLVTSPFMAAHPAAA